MWKEVRSREEGALRPSSFSRRLRSRRASELQLSNTKEIVTAHRGAVNSIQIDMIEGRYLLSGASDGSVAVYDILHATDYEAGGLISKHKSLFLVDKQLEYGHKSSVSSVLWYPIDTGLFITASYDHHVKVWDTNGIQVVMNFKLPGKVYGTAMSSIASAHMLIAAGSEDVQVRLCDIASGAFTHTLSGHRDGVMTLEWSTSSEWVLVTGGCDGAIRFWDIRRAGCYLVLDQSRSQLGRRPPFLSQESKKDLPSTAISAEYSSLTSEGSHKRISLGDGKKQSQSLPRGHHSNKGSVVQRLHPGMLSSSIRSTAHYGAVTGLKATGDGMYLVSSGSDSRLRLWDIESGCNTLVNYEAMRLQTTKTLQLAITEDSSVVFVPCMTAIKAYDIWSGLTSSIFRGHYDVVNCCCFSLRDQELYTGSNDRQLLVWSPPCSSVSEVDDVGKKGQMLVDQDSWSD